MDFDRNELAVAVTHAAGGIPNNPVPPVRAGMLIYPGPDGASFSGSDGDVTFTGTTGTSIDEKVVVPGKLFADVVRTLPDSDVNLTVNRDHVVLKCSRVKFTFPIIPGEYPQLPLPAQPCGELEAEIFGETVRKVVPACSRTGSQPALSAVRFEPDGTRFLAAGTDRYRLAAAQCEWKPVPGAPSPEAACLVPSWAADRFTRTAAGMMELGWDDRVVSLRSEHLSVVSRLISGEWPKGWRRLLEPQTCPVEVATGPLMAALKRASLAAELNQPVELVFTAGRLTVEAGDMNTASDVLDASHTGNEFRVLFGIGFLTDGLAGCGATCSFGFTAPDKPVCIASGSYMYTILPRKRM